MILLILPIFTNCIRDYPKIALLFVKESFESNMEEKLGIIHDSIYNEMQYICGELTNEEVKNDCIAYNNSFIGYYLTESKNINQKLKTIPKKIDFLYIFTDEISTTIDFNNLRTPTLVSINPFDFAIVDQMSSIKKLIKERKMNLLKLNEHLITKDITPPIKIVGNMNSKVSFLIINGCDVTFEGDVNCQNLFLMESQVITTNNQINFENVDFLILSRRSFEFNDNLVYKTKQLTYYCDFIESDSITVNGGDESISIRTKSYNTYNYFNNDNSKDLGYIFVSNSIDINSQASPMTTPILINLTYLDLSSLFELPVYTKKDTKDTLSISSNDVSSFTNLPEYQLNYNFDDVDVNRTNLQFNCAENQLYTLTPKGDIDEDEEINPSSNVNSKSLISYTYSLTFSITLYRLKSVSFSYSYSYSNFYFYDSLGSQIVLSNTVSLYFLPYIIYYLSPSYVPSYLMFPVKRKLISKEQLIGITCGSATAFFFILFIIIKIVKGGHMNDPFYYDYSISTEDMIDNVKDEKKQESEKLVDEKNESSTNEDMDFWI